MYFCKGYDFGEKVDLSKGKKVLYSESYSMNVNYCWRQNVTFQFESDLLPAVETSMFLNC